ncbi:MAG: hypothetical protein RL095_2582 [Verrucomicrobiota bacterium]|jgi:4-amino-4-deoxy-L-arabinose transferase-like glycosyltransferase
MKLFQTASPRSRRFYRYLLVIGLAALGLRLLATWGIWRDPLLHGMMSQPLEVTDMSVYLKYGRLCMEGQYQGDYNFQPFYYTVFLPVLMSLCDHPWTIALVQALLGSFTAVLSALTAARLFGRRAGLAAGIFGASCSLSLIYVPVALIEVLQAFWMALFLHLAVIAWRRDRWRDWLGLAAVLAAATLTRGSALLLLPPLLGLLIWKRRAAPLKAALATLATCLVFWGLQLPWSLHNYRETGRWTGPSTDLPEVLPFGNTPDASPSTVNYTECYHEWQDLANDPVAPVPVSSSLKQFICSEPLAWAELKLRGLLCFLDASHIPNNVNENLLESHLPWLKILPGWGLLCSLALAGLLLLLLDCRRKPARAFILASTVLAAGGIVGFYILTRFKVPFLPFCFILAGLACASLLHKRQSLIIKISALAFGVYFAWFARDDYARGLQSSFDRIARPHGTLIAIQDKLRLMDHGPEADGGWAEMDIPEAGLEIEKTWLRPDLAGRKFAGVLETAVRSPQGGRFLVDAGSDQKSLIKLPPMNSSGKIQVPVKIEFDGDGRTKVKVLFRAEGGSKLIFDIYRDQGRCQVINAEGQAESSPEVVISLLLSPIVQK